MNKKDEQAFPRNYATGMMNIHGQHELKSIPGLTKRELFAAMAMQSMILEQSRTHAEPKETWCIYAVKWADALISELNEKSNDNIVPTPPPAPYVPKTSSFDDIPF